MKPRYIILISAAVVFGLLAYSWFSYARWFRPYGERGDAYESWVTSSKNFKVKVTSRYEMNVYLPGAYYVCEAASVGSDQWHEFRVFRVDDPNPFPRERFRFVNDQIAYIYMADDFVVTVDAGHTWSIWKPVLANSEGDLVHWGIKYAYVNGDGSGEARLSRYDEKLDKIIDIQVRTGDYGMSWRMS